MRIPKSPPLIRPVPAGVPRPLWSVMIPVYNCSPFLPELLESVLMQDIGEVKMQIQVVDDCSTDADVEALVQKIGKGRIEYFRQTENKGSLRNFETCINRSRGELVHILHGDDILLDGYYTEMSRVFELFPSIGAAFCQHLHVDSKGKIRYYRDQEDGKPRLLDNWLEVIAEKQRTQYVAMVVKRSVYEHLGCFFGVVYGEDWEMWARIAKFYPVGYTPKVLAYYREHLGSISGRSYATGRNIRDIAKVIRTINNYLPEDKRKSFSKLARKNYAYYAVNRRAYIWNQHPDTRPGLPYFIEVLKMHRDPILLAKIWKLYARILLHTVRKRIDPQYTRQKYETLSV